MICYQMFLQQRNNTPLARLALRPEQAAHTVMPTPRLGASVDPRGSGPPAGSCVAALARTANRL